MQKIVEIVTTKLMQYANGIQDPRIATLMAMREYKTPTRIVAWLRERQQQHLKVWVLTHIYISIDLINK